MDSTLYDAGLVLEGGGMRGVYTAGVLDALMDAGIAIKNILAVSAGACHASSYVSGQRGRAYKTVSDFAPDKRYGSLWSLLTTGDFFGVQFVYHEIPDTLLPFDYAAYGQSPMRLLAVVTNCETGQAEYLHAADLRTDMCYIQASSSLPLLSKMVKIGGKKYLDGGVSDSIPVRRSVEMGNAKQVVVLTQHRGFEKKPSSSQRLMRLRYPRHPKLVEAAQNRHIDYNRSLDMVYALEKEGKAFVLKPKRPVEIGRVEKDIPKLERLYRDGLEDARERIGELRDFLET